MYMLYMLIIIHQYCTKIYYLQVFVGDQATCKTIRCAKHWARNEVDPVKWDNEIPVVVNLHTWNYIIYIFIITDKLGDSTSCGNVYECYFKHTRVLQPHLDP